MVVSVGYDAGKNDNKLAWINGMVIKLDSFPSLLQPYEPTNIESEPTGNDFIIEFRGEKYFGGDLAVREKTIPINYKDETKVHETTLINILTGLNKIGGNDFNIICGSPIMRRTEEEKRALKHLIQNTHHININGVDKTITIHRCEVSPEGAAGYYSLQNPPVTIQGIDFGSTTINYFYMLNKKFVNQRSGSFPYHVKNKNYEQLMKGIYSELKNQFEENLPTMLVGGLAESFLPHVKKYYPNAFIPENHVFATAIGFYRIARKLYG
jgi:plasmid segregation protein ParM